MTTTELRSLSDCITVVGVTSSNQILLDITTRTGLAMWWVTSYPRANPRLLNKPSPYFTP